MQLSEDIGGDNHMQRIVPAALALLLTTSLLAANGPKTSMPVTYTWIVTGCTDWNTASAALMLSNGDGSVVALPTREPNYPWVLLKHIATGSVYIPEDEPFTINSFKTLDEALAEFNAIESLRSPLVMTASDGAALVVALKSNVPRRRAVAH
jgi:hypothetical protein